MDDAWRAREGRITRYRGKRVGGTVVVHSIKKHMWFLEAAAALLEGDDYTERELMDTMSSAGSSSGSSTYVGLDRRVASGTTAARRHPLQ